MDQQTPPTWTTLASTLLDDGQRERELLEEFPTSETPHHVIICVRSGANLVMASAELVALTEKLIELELHGEVTK